MTTLYDEKAQAIESMQWIGALIRSCSCQDCNATRGSVEASFPCEITDQRHKFILGVTN